MLRPRFHSRYLCDSLLPCDRILHASADANVDNQHLGAALVLIDATAAMVGDAKFCWERLANEHIATLVLAASIVKVAIIDTAKIA